MDSPSASIEVLSITLSKKATDEISAVWADKIMYPEWAALLAHKYAVKRILELAVDVLNGLNIPAQNLLSTAPDELTYYWRDIFNQNYYSLPPRASPDLNVLGTMVARNIATGVYTMYQQSRRYRNFLDNGYPAGFPLFPQYVGGQGQKTERIGWDRFGNSCSRNRSIMYESTMAKLPRRRQSLRSRNHDFSDVSEPSRFG